MPTLFPGSRYYKTHTQTRNIGHAIVIFNETKINIEVSTINVED